MKYIIEADERSELVQVISVTPNGTVYTNERGIDELEELNSDYINEHFGQLQDDAYQRGLEEGKKATWGLVADASSAEYQRGLDDAWEAARKICLGKEDGGISNGELLEIFKVGSDYTALKKYSASKALAKLKAYEEKQNDKFEVGDEFVTCTGKRFVVLRVDENGEVDRYFDSEGKTYRMNAKYISMKKTGRHFDIASILEDMRND